MAYDIGPRIGIEGEKEFRKAIQDINATMKALGYEMKAVASQFDESDKSIRALTARNEVLNKQIDVQKQKLAELQKGLEAASNKYGENDRVTQGWQAQVNKATAELNKMEKELKENEEAMKNYAKSQIEAFKNSEEFKNAQEKLQGVFDVIKKAAITAATTITGTVIGSAKAAIDYESAFAGVKKTVNATEEQLAELSKGIREMSKEIPASATAIAEVAEAAGQLGIETPNILGFTRTMIDLGEATNLSSEEAASALAKFANITQMNQENFDRLGSTIVALGNNFATTEADIVSMGQRLAGAGAQIGLTEAQIMSFAAAFSSVGIEAEAGGSAFSKVMVDMQLAVETNSKRLSEFAQVAGMTSEEFRRVFQEDAASAIIAFIQGLGSAEERGLSAIKILDDMGISEVRLRDALLRAAGASDLFSESLAIGTQAWEENTALSNEAEQRYSTTASQIQILKNNLQDVAITIGEQLLPKIKEWSEKLKDVDTQPIVDGFTWLIDNAGNIAAGAAAIATAMAGWKVMTTVNAVVEAVKKWKAATEGMTIAQAALNAVQGASPIGIIITAVAALTAGLVTLWHTNEDFRNSIIGAWDAIKNAAISVWDWIVKLFKEDIPNAFKLVVDFFKNNWQEILLFITNPIAGAVKLLYNINPQFREWVDNLLLDIKEKLGAFVQFGKDIVTGLWNGISSMAQWIKDKVTGFVSGIGKTIKEFFGIESPSKLMAEYGRYIAEGLAKGIEDNSKKPEEAVLNMAEIINKAFNKVKENTNLAISIINKELELWELQNKDLEGTAEALNMKLQAQEKQLAILAENIKVTEQALNDIIYEFGESSKQAQEYTQKLLEEKIAYEKLKNEIYETTDALKLETAALAERNRVQKEKATSYQRDFQAAFRSTIQEAQILKQFGYSEKDIFDYATEQAKRIIEPYYQEASEKQKGGNTIINVYNPQPNPIELGRQIQKTQRDLALGY